MAEDLVKKFFMAAWAAVLVLWAGVILGGLLIEPAALGVGVMGIAWVTINLAVFTLLVYVVVKFKEWIEQRMDTIANRAPATAETDAELRVLRAKVDTLEQKTDRILTILENVAE
jgi:Tfp pilus assembly protein PilN